MSDTIFATLLCAVALYIAKQVNRLSRSITSLRRVLREHCDQLDDHEDRLIEIEAWKDQTSKEASDGQGQDESGGEATT